LFRSDANLIFETGDES